MARKTIQAAGGIVVRGGARPRIAVVQRSKDEAWVLPRGKLERGENPANGARREVVEETGALLAPDSRPRLAGLDVHGIPAAKGEPYHLHHDLLFHFRATAGKLQVSEESHAVVWCSPAEFDRYAVPDNVRRAYRRVLA